MKKQKQLDITNPKSIARMIDYLEDYKKTLKEQCLQFCNELADLGIKTALVSTVGNELADYVVFSKELVSQNDSECTMIMFGRDIGHVFGDGIDAAEISPILMLEYGSGSNGVPFRIVDDLAVGQGTFPGQKHAFDPNGWWYKSKRDNAWHHSYGEHPQYPMQHAYDLMQTQVNSIARRIFRLP